MVVNELKVIEPYTPAAQAYERDFASGAAPLEPYGAVYTSGLGDLGNLDGPIRLGGRSRIIARMARARRRGGLADLASDLGDATIGATLNALVAPFKAKAAKLEWAMNIITPASVVAGLGAVYVVAKDLIGKRGRR